MSLLSLIIGPGAFGIEQQTLLQLGYELHFSRSALLATWFWSRSEWSIFGYFQHQPQLRICKRMFYLTQRLHINWLRGPMARRLTTNQEIPGSTPGVIIVLLSYHDGELIILSKNKPLPVWPTFLGILQREAL